MLDINNIN